MEESKGSSAAPNHDVSDIDQGTKDTVSYDTYRRVVSEAKKAKEIAAQMKAEREADEQARMAEQNKWKELAEKLQKDLKDKEETIKRKDAMVIQSNLKQSIGRFAKDLGANENALDEIFVVGKTKELFKDIEVSSDYQINGEQVKSALAKLAESSPWFFQKQVAPPKDVNPGSKPSGVTPNDLAKLSYEELIALGKNAK